MSEYKTGRIYRIIHNQSNICYVGSTIKTLKTRWSGHKKSFETYLKTNKNPASIYPFFKKYGIENFTIILIKEYEILDRKHLLVYEQIWINKLKPVNKTSALNFLFLTDIDLKIRMQKDRIILFKKNHAYDLNKMKFKLYFDDCDYLEDIVYFYNNNNVSIIECNLRYIDKLRYTSKISKYKNCENKEKYYKDKQNHKEQIRQKYQCS
jgi:hypothetical protein